MTVEQIGKYQLTGELGHGGMAKVYLAKDLELGREVALKVISAHLENRPELRERFKKEASTIARLEHPAIVPVHDYGDNNGQPYLVMRRLTGGTLRERIETGQMDIEAIIAIIETLAKGLDFIHSNGVVHRDLKPTNILFDEYENPYLVDFGIVKLVDSTSYLTQGTIGTPAYMSPEQVYGDLPVDSRSDIYSLGIILFQMLTGELPFRAETSARQMMQQVNAEVPNILTVRSDLPPGIQQVIQRAMAKSPDERYQHVTEFAEAIVMALRSANTRVVDDNATILDDSTIFDQPIEPIGDVLATDVDAWLDDITEDEPTTPPPLPVNDKPKPQVVPVPARRRRAKPIVIGIVVLIALSLSAFYLINSRDGTAECVKPVAQVTATWLDNEQPLTIENNNIIIDREQQFTIVASDSNLNDRLTCIWNTRIGDSGEQQLAAAGCQLTLNATLSDIYPLVRLTVGSEGCEEFAIIDLFLK